MIMRPDAERLKRHVKWSEDSARPGCPSSGGGALDRLLDLNHERDAEEVAAGLHAKKSASKASRKKADAPRLL